MQLRGSPPNPRELHVQGGEESSELLRLPAEQLELRAETQHGPHGSARAPRGVCKSFRKPGRLSWEVREQDTSSTEGSRGWGFSAKRTLPSK